MPTRLPPRDTDRMTATFEMWRCAGCGKWSHARTRPTAHQRFKPPDGEDPDDVAHFVWCGPFERLLARPEDPVPPADSARIGQKIPGSEVHHGEDPNASIPPAHELSF